MNRLTIGILISFAVILSVTALNYTPDPLSSTINCQYKSACGSKPDCAQKAKACGSKPGCAQKAKACDSKPGCGSSVNTLKLGLLKVDIHRHIAAVR